MIKISVNKTLSLAAILLFASLAIVLYVTVRQSKNVKEASLSVSHTEQVLFHIQKLVLLAYENETGSRGFVITGKKEFLDPLYKSENDFKKELALLQQLLNTDNNNRQQLDSISYYIKERISFSQQMVETRVKAGLPAAIKLVESGKGKFYTDKIDSLCNKLEATEIAMLQLKKSATNTRLFQLNFILYSVLLGVLILSFFFLYNIYNDIKNRRKTQKHLELLTRQINEAHDAIYIIDADRRITSWNKGAEKLFEYSSLEALGKDVNTLLQTHISEEEIAVALKEIAKNDYWSGELKRVTKSGKIIFVRSSSTTIKDAKGVITGYVSVNFDITLQKELSAQVQHLANMVEHSSDAIMSRGLDKRIISWNEGSEKTLGYSKEEAIGKTAIELGMIRFSPEKILHIEQEVFETGGWKGEEEYFRKDGSSFTGDVTANAVRNEAGEITSLLFVIKDISLRKTLEEQLRKINDDLEQKIKIRTDELIKSEKRFRLLIEHSAEGIAMTDERSNLIYRSPTGYRITGHTSDEYAIGLAHPEDLPVIQGKFAEALNHPGTPVEFISRVQHAKGYYYWCEGTLTNLLHVDGINAVVANFRDVTMRKISEQKLIASEEQFRHTLDNMLEGAQLIGFDWRYIYVNNALVKQSKYTKEELLDGRTIPELYPGVEQTALYRELEKCFSTRKATHLESEFEFPDKTKYWFELSIQPIPEGIFILSVDITDRKVAEEKRILFTSIINSSDDAIVSQSPEGNITSWNKGAEYIFGYTEQEIIGKNIRELIPDPLKQEEDLVIRKVADGEVYKHYETQRIHKDGAVIDVSLSISPIHDSNGIITGASSIARDITKQNESRRRVIESEENLKTIFENTSEGFVLLDVNGTIKALNKTATHSIIFNIEDEEIVNKNIFDFIEADRKKHLRLVIAKVLKGEHIEFDRMHEEPGKAPMWINYTFNPVINNSEVTGVCITGKDISELRRIEQERLRMQIEEQRKITHAMLKAQEKERHAIGQELHDNVNQILVSTNLILSMVKKSPERTEQIITTAMNNLNDVINENRKIAHLFVAPNLEKESLLVQLKQLAGNMLEPASANVEFINDHFKEELLNSDVKINIYRIAQEQCTNIVKYAKATSVLFEIATVNNHFIMKIADNGVGMTAGNKINGIGLQNINGRLGLFKGTSTVTTSPGEGYTLEISIPL
ncbi:PAS domain S-box protein [Lacibacter luteus]|uniref:PAS domain S-box protein n=1 Tax=Lacibacter luteus TaxID=2508719 RepID=A0A4V1M7I4_9BACT|nr:PAS domain S-box protein [Lacibacter luteus]RXK59982.1 PAS domain S-box protein [Lacibacter luteus]